MACHTKRILIMPNIHHTPVNPVGSKSSIYYSNIHTNAHIYIYHSYPIGSMYAIYGNMDPIHIPQC